MYFFINDNPFSHQNYWQIGIGVFYPVNWISYRVYVNYSLGYYNIKFSIFRLLKMEYDIIIIGAGPAGLTVAQTCSSLNLKILVIDKNDSIGGCHRVKRISGYFTEHGPRIYTSAYLNFMTLLKEMNVNFNDLFTLYNFQFTTIGKKTIFSVISFYEMSVFFFDFMNLLFDKNYGKCTSMRNHIIDNNFSVKSIDMIDKICRLTDGAGIDRYSLNEFLQLFNQQFFYNIYQPKLPNDEGLFKIWKSFLEKKDVKFLLDSNVRFIKKENNIFTINVNNKQFNGKKVIIATPPFELVKILEKSDELIKNSFGNYDDLKYWAISTNYNVYVQVTFHWKDKLDLVKVYGFPASNWGIAFIVLSDYMTFNESNTVISTVVTVTDKKSDFINKTANECTKEEIINEIFRILKISYSNISKPNVILFSPNTNYINKQWISDDTAFVSSSLCKSDIPFEGNVKGLYNVGTHNGKHFYKFTSLESAVTNAIYLSHLLYPQLKKKYVIQKLTTISDIIINIIVFLMVALFCLVITFRWKIIN